MDWDALRRTEFPVAERWAYFDHAAVAPLPRRSIAAMHEWAEVMGRDGVTSWLGWKARLEAARVKAARLIGADPDEVAFINSTTQGIGYIAEGFPWQNGDNVVSVADEYPSNVYPWMNLASRGVALKRAACPEGRVDLDRIDEAIDGSTRLVTISMVEFASGFRVNLDALAGLCLFRGVALFVDAIQGLGALPLDVGRTQVDFVAADGHKWLLGPEGAGLLFIRKPWIERLRCVVGLGSHSVVNAHNYHEIDMTLKPDARRWEGGCYNMAGVQGLSASLGLFLEIGLDVVSARVLELADEVRAIAEAEGWRVYGSTRSRDRSGIVSIERPGVDPEATVMHARSQGVVISCRAGRVRISPHIVNDRSDLDRLARVLREAPAG